MHDSIFFTKLVGNLSFSIDRKIKKRCAAFIFLGIWCISLLTACSSREDNAEKFYLRGLMLYNEGAYDKARLEFSNSVQSDPQLGKSHYYLGLIAKKNGNFKRTFQNMSLAARYDPSNIDAKINVAELYVMSKKFDKAIAQVDDIAVLDANNFEALRVRAAALLGLKSFKEADLVLDKAIALRSSDAALYGLKSVVSTEHGDVEKSLKYIDKALSIATNKTQYLLLRLGVFEKTGNKLAIESTMRNLIDENPDQPIFVNSLLIFLSSQGKFAEGEKLIRRYVESYPGDINTKLKLVETIAMQDDARAMHALNEMIATSVNEAELLFYRIGLYVRKGNTADALSELTKIIDGPVYGGTSQRRARALMAEIYFQQKKIIEALDLLQVNLSEDAQHEQSLLLQANYDLSKKHFDLATDSLRTVLRNNPSSEQALVSLGNVYLQSGSQLLADDSFRQALDLNAGNVDAALPVVRRLIESQDLRRSDDIVTNALERKPSDLRLLALLTQIKLLKKDWSAAQALAKRLQVYSASEAFGVYLEGQTLQGQKLFAESIVRYERALELNPSLRPAFEALATCHLALGQKAILFEYISSFRSRYPKNIIGDVLKAQILFKDSRLKEAIAVLTRSLDIVPSWAKGYAIKAKYLQLDGNIDGALQTYREAIRNNPLNASLKILLAAFYQQQSQFDKAEDVYLTLIKEDPDNLLVVNNYASLLLDSIPSAENFTRALAIAAKLKNHDMPQYCDTYGWALAKNERYAEAEQVLRIALKDGHHLPEIHLHLGLTLKHQGRFEEATKVLKIARKEARGREALAKTIETELAALELR